MTTILILGFNTLMPSFKTGAAALTVAALTSLSLTACGSDSSPSNSGSGEKIDVVASFYPLAFAAEQIGGDKVKVTSLTQPGVEPHDLELTPQQVAALPKAKLAVYEKGFQSSVDDAIKSSAKSDAVLDVAPSADLSLKLSQTTSIGSDEHAEEDHDHEHASDADPHFWTDPVRYKAVANAISAKLQKQDPKNAETYKKNAEAFVKKLDDLHAKFSAGLKQCTNRSLVTGHAAFGYLAQRYNLKQVGVAGVSPDAEPTPARLKQVADYTKKNNVKTIYSETLVSPKTSKTVARQTGAKVEVLDPIEGITSASKGKNYFEVMTSNLSTLQKGQGCS